MRAGIDLRIIYVRNYGKKLFIMLGLAALWVLMFFTADALINNSLLYRVTIDNYLVFSYPYGVVVDDVLINDKADEKSVQSSHSFSVPSVREFSSYKSLEGKFSFYYPETFTLEPQSFPGGEVLYHIDFSEKSGTMHGFIQVWNMPGSLDKFLKGSIASSQQKFKYFKSGSLKINGLSGYYWDYSALSDNSYFKGNEVFLKKNNLMYRISYFVPEKEWNDSQSGLFWKIVSSFKTF